MNNANITSLAKIHELTITLKLNNPNFICDFKLEKDYNPWQKSFETQRKYFELLERGAGGDVEAAIEYCKLELAGKVAHGPIG